VPDLVITDLRMPGMDGLEFLREIKAIDERIHVIMMTSYATDYTTSEAFRAGVFYHITKPFEPEKLKIVIRKALASRRQLIEIEELKQRAPGGGAYVGRAKPTLEMLDLVAQVAGTKATALVRGESGTGKELVARLINS
jgi:DNA-binding NtrC family response regulator